MSRFQRPRFQRPPSITSGTTSHSPRHAIISSKPMIKTVAQLLSDLVRTEERVLSKHRITHGPTIGKMYEGLTRKVVDQSVPQDANISVVTGFVEGRDGTRSDEQDVMVVYGEGEVVPNTDSYIFPVDQVLVCIEVKKTLSKAALIEGFNNLNTLRGLSPQHRMDIGESVIHGFHQIAGRLAPPRSRLSEVPPLYQHVWHNLVLRRALPARVLLGYHGYKTEGGLRSGICDHIKALGASKAPFGPLHVPDATLNLHGSVVVNAAAPWWAPIIDDWWPLLMSNATTRPIEVLLEVIWTRFLQRGFTTAHVFGEDLDIEPWHRFLDARHQTDPLGWSYRELPFSAKLLKAEPPKSIEWKPPIVSQDAFILANILCKVDDLDLRELDWPQNALNPAVAELEKHSVIGRSFFDQNRIGLLTDQLICMITNKGDYVVGENSSGRLVRSLRKHGHIPGSDEAAVLAAVIKHTEGGIEAEGRLLPGDGIGWSGLVSDVFAAKATPTEPESDDKPPRN
jgi:hypothetical protein